jgi:RHS repeat-associated protein
MQYDANGNLLNDGTNTYNWNARNELVQITGGSTSTFTYDALGRRQSVTVNGVASNYVYDGLNIVGELNTGTTYLTGLGVDQMLAMESSNGAQIASYLTDALGSTIRLTDQNGSKLVDYTYSLYGATNADASIVNPFQYAGRENDGTGLYYNRARYYSSTLQRFISQDPSGLSAGVNMYAYVGGNPVMSTDPFGLQAIWSGIGANDGAGYAAQQSVFVTYGADQSSSGWANKEQLVFPIPLTPLGVDITATIKQDGSYSIYTGIRATGASYAHTSEYRCTVGTIKGLTVKASTNFGLGEAGGSGSISAALNGSYVGAQVAVGGFGTIKRGGVWGWAPPSPGIGWTW